MTNIELTAIHTAIRLARERCEAEGVQNLRIFEHTANANIELLLGRINRTLPDGWPALMAEFQARRWDPS